MIVPVRRMENGKRYIQFVISAQLLAKLKAMATLEHCSMSSLCERILADAASKHEVNL